VESTVAYVVPTNALVNQVRRDLNTVFESYGYRIETTLPYYQVDDIEDQILTETHIDIIVTTPEKLDFLVRKPHPSLDNLRLVVLDEAHNLSDETRGAKIELLIATIKQRRRDVNFLLLSPFIRNAKEIAEWIAGSKQSSTALTFTWYPTKQFIGCNIFEKNK